MPRLLLENAVLPLADDPSHDAVAVQEDKIVAVGAGDALRSAGSYDRRIDLGGRTLLPGFNDAHVHIWKAGRLLTSLVDLRGAESFAEVRDALARRAGETEGWVLARGVNELRLAEGRLPDRHDLDAWLPGRSVWLTRVCNHIGVASTAALREAGVVRSTDAPPGGEVLRDSAGEPTGVLTETALSLVTPHLPEPSEAELRVMIRAQTAKQLRMGITAATDPGVDDRLLAVYRRMDERGGLPLRCNVMRLAPEDPTDETMRDWVRPTVTDFLRVDTAKLFLDGGLSGATAALSTPYRHADSLGVLRYEAHEYAALCRLADAAGYRVATHVIGDRAIGTALDAFESLPPHVASRARFEHLGLPTANDLRRAARLGVGVATQPRFLPELGGNFREYLPDAYPITPYPLRDMLGAGLTVALSTDAPVVRDERPLAGVASAVDRLDGSGRPIGPDQAIRLREALLACTAGGAKLSGDADRFGSIQPGRWADLAVLRRSPLETPPAELAEIEVDMTFVGGELVHEL